jgi:hypothetical protein
MPQDPLDNDGKYKATSHIEFSIKCKDLQLCFKWNNVQLLFVNIMHTKSAFELDVGCGDKKPWSLHTI